MSDKPEAPKNGAQPIEPNSAVSVQGVVVLIALDDGSLRQAHIDKIEHMRTIVDICTMNEKKGLKLGSTDFSYILNQDASEPQPDAEEDDGRADEGGTENP